MSAVVTRISSTSGHEYLDTPFPVDQVNQQDSAASSAQGATAGEKFQFASVDSSAGNVHPEPEAVPAESLSYQAKTQTTIGGLNQVRGEFWGEYPALVAAEDVPLANGSVVRHRHFDLAATAPVLLHSSVLSEKKGRVQQSSTARKCFGLRVFEGFLHHNDITWTGIDESGFPSISAE